MRNALLLVLSLLGATLCFAAEVYPSKPVRVVVPFPPGGGGDITARLISQQLSLQFGSSFVVENRAGASGTIGDAFVAKAAPDGYTLMLMDTSTTIVPSLYKSLPFDVTKDYSPISQISGAPAALVVPSSTKHNTLKDFIAAAQANPGKLNYGSGGIGTNIHLMAELFKLQARVNVVHIPYKGAGDVMAALLAGQVEMLITSIPAVLPQVKAGRVRSLAVTTDGRRSPMLPDTPSMSEAGVAGMEVYNWNGLVGPAGMPREVISKLHDELVKALAAPSVKEQFTNQGAETVGNSPEEFAGHIRREVQRWGEVVRAAGIPPE